MIHLAEHAILGAVQSVRPRAVLSLLTIMKIHVRPYQLNQPAMAAHYESMLAHFPNAHLVDVTPDVARRAAQLRAMHKLQPADALHLATSLVHRATAWITNDHKKRRLAPLID